jgi:hypothetical protein
MSGSTATPVTIPSWLTLGQLVVGIGAILIFIGFMLGALSASNLPTANSAGNESTYQADQVAFFVITGIGILVAFAGWGMHAVWPKYKARPRPAPAPAPSSSPAGPAMPPPPPPAAAPAVPNCPKCGQPTTFIAQYGRYYCYTDNVYA